MPLSPGDHVTRLGGSDLATLVQGCLENDNKVSNKRRKHFASRVPEEVFQLIEAEAFAATSRDARQG